MNLHINTSHWAKALISVLVLGSAIVFGSCKGDDTITNTGGGGSTGILKIPIPGGGSISIPTFGATNIKGIMATYLDSQTAEKRAMGLFFGSYMSEYVYAGNVSVNANVIDTLSISIPPITSIIFYVRPKPTTTPPDTLVGVEFDGSTHSWSVSGNGGIPALSNLNVTSPNGIATITAPAAGAAVPRNQALTVSWTGSGNDSVFIVVRDTLLNSIEAVTGGTSITFPASSMATLAPGSGEIEVNRVRYAIASAGGQTYLALAVAGTRVGVTLQ